MLNKVTLNNVSLEYMKVILEPLLWETRILESFFLNIINKLLNVYRWASIVTPT